VTHHSKLIRLYERLYRTYGPQHWWPGESAFEVMTGAVLTQNTHWRNVEKALKNLKENDCLELESIIALHPDELAMLIKPSGFFNVKTRRLKNLCHWFAEVGAMDAVATWQTDRLRSGLLSINGIGPETADSILLYAFHRPVFVIDTYTRRLLRQLELIKGDEGYEALREMFQSGLPEEPALYNEYHALIVRHGKERCGGVAECKHCYVENPLMREA